nr:unnamed protein product [Callosobruchus chinensis]CAH7717942.1 unnamed protein product [Callosobruchus chinensis]CAH7724687.1 unnamed protein product [Callosobruchus chinensis]CAH7751101.1 unnamed protein product [Callosobruchus chinensis]CAH7758493.1 unnamed protein product [Callosobruchus chinensis]
MDRWGTVSLKTYPAFYHDKKNFAIGTAIKNTDDKIIGHVIGHHKHYYPITPMDGSFMFCGRYGLEQLTKKQKFIMFQKKVYSVDSFKHTFPTLVNQEEQCCVYV